MEEDGGGRMGVGEEGGCWLTIEASVLTLSPSLKSCEKRCW